MYGWLIAVGEMNLSAGTTILYIQKTCFRSVCFLVITGTCLLYRVGSVSVCRGGMCHVQVCLQVHLDRRGRKHSVSVVLTGRHALKQAQVECFQNVQVIGNGPSTCFHDTVMLLYRTVRWTASTKAGTMTHHVRFSSHTHRFCLRLPPGRNRTLHFTFLSRYK